MGFLLSAMKLFCIDLSLHCGYAVLGSQSHSDPQLLAYGTIHYEGVPVRERNNYPTSYLLVVEEHVNNVISMVEKHQPDHIVIEETNKGKNRYSQKMLEFLHHELLTNFKGRWECPITYLDTSAWRSTLGIWMSKDQKKINAKINKAKREGGDKAARATKKVLGVKGKFNKKHVAINHANITFGLSLKMKDNDAADAICLGLAYLKGTTPSNGV